MSKHVAGKWFAVELSVEEKRALDEAMQAILEVLGPRLVGLRAGQRRKLVKMGGRSVGFVADCLNYAIRNPQFKPAFFEIEAFRRSVATIELLRSVLKRLVQIRDRLDDGVTLAGSDAMVCSLAYYKSVKAAHKMNVPGAAAIVEDLAKRFAGHTGRPPAAGRSKA